MSRRIDEAVSPTPRDPKLGFGMPCREAPHAATTLEARRTKQSFGTRKWVLWAP
jgi:hypothetical protein